MGWDALDVIVWLLTWGLTGVIFVSVICGAVLRRDARIRRDVIRGHRGDAESGS